jgi:hypothetical protein
LSKDFKTSNGKFVHNIVKGYTNMNYPEGEADNAWEKLKNKYEPVSAPSMVRLDNWFR